MDKRDLILKALVKYEGKWPDVPEDKDCLTLSMLSGEIKVSMINSSAIHKELDKVWFDFVCTKSEFEAVLQKLRDAAPEGAEYYSPRDGSFVECWFKFNEEWMFSTVTGANWHHLIPQSIIENRQLIPLNKAANPEPEKWAPEVGRSYSIIEDSRLMYGAGESGECIGHIEDCAIIRMSYGLGCFKYEFLQPLLTEAEIERERLYDEIFSLDAGMDDYQINRVIEFIQGRDND